MSGRCAFAYEADAIVFATAIGAAQLSDVGTARAQPE
jgi:hypothetical protein